MSAVLQRVMSRHEFFAWAQAQERRYEFDGLQPVAMTGGNLGHSVLTGNINRHLGNLLSGRRCRPLGPDAGVATIGQAVRYPDAVVTCTAFNSRDRLVPDPVILFEVVSPTSVRIDRVIKLREYQAVPTVRRYIVVEADAAALNVFSRTAADELFVATGLTDGDVLELPEIGIELPVADLYEGVVLEVSEPDGR